MPTSLDEVLKLNITYAAEYDGAYYFQPHSDDKFDHCMWKVDKESGKVSYFDMMDYLLDIANDAVEIDFRSLKRAS